VKQLHSDADQLAAAKRDPALFASFYVGHAVWVERWLRGQLSDGQVVADLTAETFAQALGSLERFKPSGAGSGTAWIFGIARNLLRHYFEHRNVEQSARARLGMPQRAAVSGEYEDADARLDALALAREIEDALGALSPVLRETLELRAFDELPYSQIAVRTGTSEANARLRVTRALRALSARVTANRETLL